MNASPACTLMHVSGTDRENPPPSGDKDACVRVITHLSKATTVLKTFLRERCTASSAQYMRVVSSN